MKHPGKVISALAVFVMAGAICLAADKTATQTKPRPPDVDTFGYPTNLAKAYAMGQAEATRDLSNGVVRIKSSGLPAPESSVYHKLLEQRCGVRLEPIAGCIVTSGLVEYRRGYNELTQAFLRQKFGTNILDRLYAEAKVRAFAQAEATPATARRTYVVKPGDTLLRIARLHGITVKQLFDANPGVKPNQLPVNQYLVIPPKAQP